MAGPCRFWAQGTCRNGDNCRFEHAPRESGGYQGGGGGGGNRGGNQGGGGYQGNQSGNRFAPLQNQENSRHTGGRLPPASTSPEIRLQLDKAAIIVDLSSERPQWPLSAYGPGRFAPVQLFGGPSREQSFEEMRLKHYMGVAAGNSQGAIQEVEKMVQAAELQTQNALRDVDGGIQFILRSENEHPNRVDIVRDSMSGAIVPNPFGSAAPPQTSAFGAPTQSLGTFGTPSPIVPNPFGAPSQPSHTANALGTPVFGAPTPSGAFGQRPTLGERPNPFGAPSASAFGAPSQLGRGNGAFGQPSALGQKSNPFGAPSGSSASGSAPFTSSSQAPGVFGAPQPAALNPFGSTQQPFSAFGAPTQSSTLNSLPTATPTPFGDPSPAARNPFGATQPAVTSNPFGKAAPSQSNPFGTTPAPAASNPFSTTSSQPNTTSQGNPFGTTPSAAQPNPFGAAPNPSPFGAALSQPQRPSPFGQPGVQQANGNAFGRGGFQSMTNGITAAGKSSSAYSAPTSAGNPPLRSYVSTDATGSLTMFRGKRVEYKDKNPGTIGRDGTWRRIFFPDGPPSYVRDAEVPEENYDDETRQAFETLRLTGSFPNNEMPALPPKGEWVRWDF